MLKVELNSEIALIRMEHGKVNAMDLEFCRALTNELLHQEANSECVAAVLTGNDRVFSAGVDLVRLVNESQSYLDEFLPALSDCFKTIFRFSKPIVAAINGHAIAGGCILATACDRRLIQPRVRIGLPELRVGVPLPSVAIEIMRFAVAREAFQAMVTMGSNYRDDEAVAVGLADRIVAKEDLLDQAIKATSELTAIPACVFSLSKRQIRFHAESKIQVSEAEHEAEIRSLWHHDDIQAEIRQYVKDRLKR